MDPSSSSPNPVPDAGDVLSRVASNVAVHLYEMELKEDGTFECTAFVGAGVERLLGPIPDGVPPEDAWERAVHPSDRAAYDRAYEQLGQGTPVELEYRLVGYDGVTRRVWDRMHPRRTGGRLVVDGIVVDVSQRQEASEKFASVRRELEHFAYHDPLTDLPNRTYFREHLDRAIARARRDGGAVAVVFVDLDDFKLVNDSFGHAAGDELLQQLAGRLRGRMRASDFVARQGGDEFLIVVEVPPGKEGTDEGHAMRAAQHVASRVREALASPFGLGGVETHMSASLGVSLYPADAENAETLLKHADLAMYRAKGLGPDECRFYSGDADRDLVQLSSVARLRAAVERGDGLVLHYQPVVVLQTGEAVGAEALVRWVDGDRGIIPPSQFIALVERTGLVVPLSEWVLEEACRQAAEWHARGLSLDVAVNLPPSFWRPQAVADVLDTLDRHGLKPQHLTVELTERTTLIDPGRNRLLVQLQNRGVRLALDDFGAGYSTLSRLAELRADSIKIDQQFVAGLPDDVRLCRLVSWMVQLGQTLGVSTVAEGVENGDQIRYLMAQGCTLGQGYLFSPALPPAELEALVAAGPVAPRARSASEASAA